jgi:hypothetical protein
VVESKFPLQNPHNAVPHTNPLTIESHIPSVVSDNTAQSALAAISALQNHIRGLEGSIFKAHIQLTCLDMETFFSSHPDLEGFEISGYHDEGDFIANAELFFRDRTCDSDADGELAYELVELLNKHTDAAYKLAINNEHYSDAAKVAQSLMGSTEHAAWMAEREAFALSESTPSALPAATSALRV